MNPEKFRTIRKESGYTQQQLADRVKMSRDFITAIENGRRNPSLATLTRIANVLNCSVKDFF